MKGNWHFLPSFVVQVAGASLGLTGMEAGVGAGVGAGAGAEEPPLNPSHLSLQSTQGFGVP